jgi:hypothetical protein
MPSKSESPPSPHPPSCDAIGGERASEHESPAVADGSREQEGEGWSWLTTRCCCSTNTTFPHERGLSVNFCRVIEED